ncbi:leucine--tRNA ligase, partial [uncultured Nocardioides sp.]|uniref:leucine--tRNA ligase n=1 Tax=uncultured Nocardioides sp. TaxID=198441 RepID=UPI00261B3E82
MSEQVQQEEPTSYDVRAVEEKWRPVWDELQPFRADDDSPREKKYALTMFPYPSGDLHMGHAEVFALHDVVARYWWQRGYEVLNPMGFDSFGLPAENAAIRNDEHPATYTKANIAKSIESCQRYAASFDWSRTFNTSDPEYYRWTQWLFARFYERGLAYRKKSPVNWCPQDQTVLANEQVVAGACERCGAEVTKKELTQWYFKITDYAQELLDGLDDLEKTWPDRVVTAQRNWIGRSEGAHVDFVVQGREEPVTVYTTRPDTIFGTTFMVVAVDAALADELVTDAQRPAFEAYREEVRRASEIERLATDRPKTGVDLGVTATNPVTGEQIPVWATDYVLADYGTGAVMGVPGGDQRDWEFATAMGLPIVRTTEPPAGFEGEAYAGEGPAINSPAPGQSTALNINGLDVDAAKRATIDFLEEMKAGTGAVNFRLRDWLLSRQRYWGAPIPVVHCPEHGEVLVPDEQLPVELPELRGADLKPKGTSPLAAAEEWVNTTCPTCGGPATRDGDTMDTFVDSSWYMFRYCSPHETDRVFDSEKVNAWMACDLYVGGVEHAVLHLLYGRFFTKVLNDMGLVDFREPWLAQLNQGFVINQGKKMSKSLGNGVNLGEQLEAFGVDAVRLTLVFAGPPEDDIDWANMSPDGSLKFLQRAWRLSG